MADWRRCLLEPPTPADCPGSMRQALHSLITSLVRAAMPALCPQAFDVLDCAREGGSDRLSPSWAVRSCLRRARFGRWRPEAAGPAGDLAAARDPGRSP